MALERWDLGLGKAEKLAAVRASCRRARKKALRAALSACQPTPDPRTPDPESVLESSEPEFTLPAFSPSSLSPRSSSCSPSAAAMMVALAPASPQKMLHAEAAATPPTPVLTETSQRITFITV
eukprot:1594362-Rhodomonas_salina.2